MYRNKGYYYQAPLKVGYKIHNHVVKVKTTITVTHTSLKVDGCRVCR